MINAAGRLAPAALRSEYQFLEVEMERVLNLPRRIAADYRTGVAEAVS